VVHRCSGLASALFLIVAGLTGAIIPFYDELERVLNPHLHVVQASGTALRPDELIAAAERSIPRAQVATVYLGRPADSAAAFYLDARVDPQTGAEYELPFDEVFIDPYSGRLLGRRSSGSLGLDREHLMPTLYQLHHTMLLPEPWGRWLLGGAALVWLVNCFIGFYLTLPQGRRSFLSAWAASWRVRLTRSVLPLSFGFHRAAGLWTWAMMLVLALSAVQFNLYDEVFSPALSMVASSEDPYETIPDAGQPLADAPLGWREALPRGRELMERRAVREGFEIRAEWRLSLVRNGGYYVYAVNSSRDVRDSNRGGETQVFFSAINGRELGFAHPYSAAGNAVTSWLSSLHMARLWGLPYRLFMSAMGVLVGVFALAGVIVWLKRREPASA
jgi:uncharacterized iron-regulated membrane protein